MRRFAVERCEIEPERDVQFGLERFGQRMVVARKGDDISSLECDVDVMGAQLWSLEVDEDGGVWRGLTDTTHECANSFRGGVRAVDPKGIGACHSQGLYPVGCPAGRTESGDDLSVRHDHDGARTLRGCTWLVRC